MHWVLILINIKGGAEKQKCQKGLIFATGICSCNSIFELWTKAYILILKYSKMLATIKIEKIATVVYWIQLYEYALV